MLSELYVDTHYTTALIMNNNYLRA